MAEELGLERAKQDVRLRKYQAALQAIRNSDNTTRILDYQHGPTLGVRTLLARDSRGKATHASVETLARGILGQAHATMAEPFVEATHSLARAAPGQGIAQGCRSRNVPRWRYR